MNAPEPTREEMEALRAAPEVASWRSILMTYKMLYSILESKIQKEHTTIPRLQVFFVLYFEGPQIPVKLANRLMVTRGNMSTLLKRMIDEELVGPCYETGTESRPGYKLTEKGRAQFLKIFPQHVANIQNLLPPLSRSTMEELLALQTRIFDEHRLGVPVSPATSK